ncbi:MAG TPA: error-prone DNA polymerase [Alphaproteobacteria bacterium]
MNNYAELQVTTNFSFLRGASHPPELVLRAAELGLGGIAITDRNSLAGIVRAHAAARELKFRLIVGARLDFIDAPGVLAYPRDRAAYGRLTQLLTDGKRRAEKGGCHLGFADLMGYGDGLRIVALPPDRLDQAYVEHLAALARRFPNAMVAVHRLYGAEDQRRIADTAALAQAAHLPIVATNDVHYHVPERRALQDVLTCVREGCTITQAGLRLAANAERHLKSPDEMARLFRDRPDALARTLEIADSCGFSLAELKYEYPEEPVPQGRTPQEELERLTWLHAPERYPAGVPEKVRAVLAKELALIAELDYARYFLTVHDIVRYARSLDILCQGRGSAANSAVCYVLGITAVDPDKVGLLFERFISAERREPPDIDVDFEHERREEVIQYIYRKYGRHRAGIVATVITYRTKSAVRDVGKAFGLSEDTIGALADALWRRGDGAVRASDVREGGVDPDDPAIAKALSLSRELLGFPRHLSQHTGGFVITRERLSEVVPIENAAMEDRTTIEWDKDDLDELGMLKIDVLALGMLTCIRKGLDLLKNHYGLVRETYEIATGPEDPAVYDMLGRADSIGVFQVESRAQMTMLPRLKPEKFYDLVVEVAIVRPGPIQGDMVHPYLRRRAGKEPAEFPKEELREVLGNTYGVPLFQEQAMKIAIVAAGFTAAEANQLRRAMATFRHAGTIHKLRARFIDGMVARGYERDFAERCFRQIEGFGDYGFPESHAASFALLVYVSAWLKCHYPAVFACAILNSQPMGFYAPAQLVRDARDHGVEVRPVDVNHSEWDCTLEKTARGAFALRLGFRQVKGFREVDAAKLVAARGAGFATLRAAWRAGLSVRALVTLADADAWGSLGLKRRDALWQIKGLGGEPLPLFAFAEATLQPGHNLPPSARAEPAVAVVLPAMTAGEQVLADYRHLGLSLKQHPVALLRQSFAADGIVPNARLAQAPDGSRVTVAGIVLVRQQPGTASGVIFMTIEDETGVANVIVWRNVFERFRKNVLASRLIAVRGRMQRDDSGYVIHVVAERFTDLSHRLHDLIARPSQDINEADEPRGRGRARRAALVPASRDFH